MPTELGPPELGREMKESAYEAGARDNFPVQRSSRSRRLSRLAIWVGVALLIAGGVALVVLRRAQAGPQIHYETALADRGTIAAKVTATGNVSALLTVQVGSQVSGRVQELFVDYNSPVKKEEVIARLDPLLYQAAVEQAQAQYLSAQSSLKKDQAQEVNAKITYDRDKSLIASQVIAQSDVDTAEANYEVAKAQIDADQSNVQSALATLNQAKVNLGYTTIISPIDGIVISRSVDVGQTVAASFQAPVLFTIAQDLGTMQVDTNVGEADVGRLVAGMKATFTVDAYPTREFTGTLRQIRNAAQTLQNVVTYDAVIDVKNPDLALKPGMTANVTFVAAQKDNVVRLKNAALRFEPDPQLLQRMKLSEPAQAASAQDPNRRNLWVLRDGKPVLVQVTVGVSDGTWSELVQGDIQTGDELITDMSLNAQRGFF